jgi:hypothetical protein
MFNLSLFVLGSKPPRRVCSSLLLFYFLDHTTAPNRVRLVCLVPTVAVHPKGVLVFVHLLLIFCTKKGTFAADFLH